MERLPLDSRRSILKAKLRGSSNREVANEIGVSKGTVANVVAEAREGEIPEIDAIDEQLDALFDLGKRLNAADLDATTAHTGLDVVEWLDEMDIEAVQIKAFRDRLDELTADSDAMDEYTTAAMHLHNLETETSLEADGELGDLLADFEARSTDEIERLEAAARAIRRLDLDGDELTTAIERAVAIQELGFTLPAAKGVVKELPTDETADEEEAVQSLIDAYREYESLEDAVEALRDEKTELSKEVEDLEEKITQHKTDREKLDNAQTQLEETLNIQRAALGELKETREEIYEQIAVDRSERSRLRSEIAECSDELDELQIERDVVHAYRQLLREKKLPDSVLTDLELLLNVRTHSPDSGLWILEPDARERVGTELIRVAEEMIEGEEMIPVAEHERQLREKGNTEQTLDELETEVTAAVTVLEFLETGELSADLLETLQKVNEGNETYHSDTWVENGTEEVRQFLVEQVEALTEGQQVIAMARHRELLDECREQYISELQSALESVERLATEIEAQQDRLDDEWIDDVAATVRTSLESADDATTEEQIATAIKEALDEELSRRVEVECMNGSPPDRHGDNDAPVR